jgi:RHS repeat-associated protein
MLDVREKAGDSNKREAGQTEARSPQSLAAPSTISLPKGGGAIRGIGEKFAANPVTGTGSLSVPLATSPGRSGFGPQLSLSYDSGAGNGPFGVGWNLSLPSITRKTDKGLPKYQDGDESDVFILSGTEDLVPVLIQNAANQWVREVVLPRTVNQVTYEIQRYRPRIEGLFARIERWTNQSDPKDSFWRSISRDNITTWYGKTEESRIADPADPTNIFTWLICESYDDKGNVIAYQYKPENSENVDTTQAHERNRSSDTRKANRYLKHIRYGNHTPYLPQLLIDQPWPTVPADDKWFFEVVFDFGEHHADVPIPGVEVAKWKCRLDPFSSYRSCFDVRTYRLCQRVLMFHHFEGEANVDRDCLVRSTDLTYSHEEDSKDTRNPIHSVLVSVSQSGYKRRAGGYLKKSLPPLEFEYTRADIDETVRDLDPGSLENLPYGLDGANYQLVDLDGEGSSGILTEQAGGWFYKRNLSPINVVQQDGEQHTEARFAPIEVVVEKRSLAAISGGRQHLLDLAGDGQLDLVMLDGPSPGFYERTPDGHWETFRTFVSLPNIEWNNPNLNFVDLTGDGHADVLITEDEVFCWYPSLAKEGFDAAERTQQKSDEEKGPRLVFADPEHSIFLADLSGDGLTDLVRIRNGEVCYWPNLGYGRFGSRVTMDNSPWFDNPERFDPKRIQLADIDGSGVTDIVYLGRNIVTLYFNQAGNSWSEPRPLGQFPEIDNLSSVTVMDLLGNGTACLVWSSPLLGNALRPIRYIDLMGGNKPHLLTRTVNNLGAETEVSYAPSTRFYLQDKLAGKPWITRLPFPVHCVERVTVTDKWRKTSFSSTYSYHHGYFDGIEREFRGFGRVEQVDVESYGEFEQGNTASPYITDDKTLYQPPVKTIRWFHTGAFLDHKRILSQFEHEYFPRWLEDSQPDLKIAFQENPLPEPDLEAEDLSAEEWREALRACRGLMLRQEVVELDVDALQRSVDPEQLPVKLFSTAYLNCHIRCLQPQGINRHAVFLVAQSEAITYDYELDIRKEQLPKLTPDPRIAHTLNLQYDEYANVLQSVAVVYPRLGRFEDDAKLADGLTDALTLIRQVQKEETHLGYSETRYTEDFGTKLEDKVAGIDNHRLRVPCEVLTYELTGIKPASGLHFTINELRALQLSLVHQKSGQPVVDIPYQRIPNRITPEKRIVEHARTLFFAENLVDPLPFREHGRLGLTYEAYKLALTAELLDAVFKDGAGNNKLDQTIDGLITARARLNDPAVSGYLTGAKLVTRFASIPAPELTDQYWIRSGIAGFAPDAAQHFYLPERYTDPFDNVTTVDYERDLFVKSSTDAMGNTTAITQFDFRVLAPREMHDINNNLSEVVFDVLGLPSAMALKGKGNEGDNFTEFDDALANPELAELTAFFNAATFDEAQARLWLRNTTARHVYHFGETSKVDGSIAWGTHPSCACGILREQHVSQLADKQSPLQVGFEYSDGMGSVIGRKVQAEPEAKGKPFRWIASGKTILNNKGKPVKQYEPYFSSPAVGHRFEEPREEGVTAVIYYDAVGRTVRTEMPDGSFSRVEFSPWHVRTFDQNDTVKQPGNPWFASKTAATATPEENRAAGLAAEHADTPALTILDSLGREVISVAHNRVKDVAGLMKDEKYLTFTKLDSEGKLLWIRDARKNLVMQYITPPVSNDQVTDPIVGFVPCYDIAGNLLFQHSMDAGDRWMLSDAAGKPMLGWNSRGHTFRIAYDALHRPVGSFVKGADPLDASRIIQFEKVIYGDTPTNGLSDTPADDQTRRLNLRGKVYKHHDTAGLVISVGRNAAIGTDEAFDFKGNPLRSTRQLVKDHKATPDWSQDPVLVTEVFTSSARYDALNRPIQLVAPHSDQQGAKFNVVRPGYNEATLLERVDVWLEQDAEPTALLIPDTASLRAVTNIDYDAKGQRTRIEYNEARHPLITEYTYDNATFRLVHLVTTRPEHPEADKLTLQDLSYTYDPIGNITDIRDAAQQPVFFKNTLITPSNIYVYDALYRLIKAEGREHAAQNNSQRDATNFDPIISIPFPNSPEALQRYIEDYEYDGVGNILALHHTGGAVERWIRRYQYALDSNRLLATRLPDDPDKLPDYTAAPGYKAKYTYDSHGSMTSMLNLPVMEWDFKDQLHATQRQVVNNGVGDKTYYVYDAGGQRVRKLTETPGGNPKDERIYLGGFEVYRKYNGNGKAVTLERETLHVMDDKQRIALIETRTRLVGDDPAPRQLVRYQLGNHLGSAALELDDQAQVISYEEYHPYGTTAYEAARSNTETPKRYRYTGKERDEETGFSYHGARYYAPWLGRWTCSDPAGLIDGSNLYRYARNAPTSYTDGSGQDPDPVSDEQRQKDDAQLKAIGVTRQQVIDYGTLSRGDFRKKYGGGSFFGEVRFRLSFPSDKVDALPSALLYRVLPKTNSDQTIYMFPSGRLGTIAGETANRAKEVQAPTGTGALLASAKFVYKAATTGTGEYDTTVQALGDNLEGIASGPAAARLNRASNSAGVVVVSKPGGVVGTTGRAGVTTTATAIEAPPPARPQPSLNNFGGTFTATWKDSPSAKMRFSISKSQGSAGDEEHVTVFDAYRGEEPKGTGGEMLAVALRAAGASKPTVFSLRDIVEPETLRELNKGTPFADTVIGKMFTRSAQEFGGKVESMEIYRERKDVGREFQYNAVVKVSY